VAYRDDAGDVCEAPTADGTLRAELAGGDVRLAVARRSIHIAERFATMIAHHPKRPAKDRRTSLAITGQLIVARDVPRDGLGVWVEVEPGAARAGFRRIFGVEPRSLLDPGGLAGLAALDRLAQRVRQALAHLAVDVRRAFELGPAGSRGLDKVLAVDHGEHIVVYARRLFRDRARFALSVHDDGRIAVRGRRGARSGEVTVRSRHGVTVVGDYLRFADPQGADLAKVSLPWILPGDRGELARWIGQRIDRDVPRVSDSGAWPPRLVADADPAR
jgi:hypothetical protein